MKIAIKFGDNDFHGTFNNLLETLFRAYQYSDTLPDNKPQLLKLINSMVLAHYLAFQNNFKYRCEKEDLLHIEKYLTIDERKLLLNGEVDEYLNSLIDGWDNSSTFILDTELYNNNIYSV